MGPNGSPSSVSHLFVGDVVSVGDAEELSEASHLHGLYPSLCVSCVSELSAIFLSFQMVWSLASVAVA